MLDDLQSAASEHGLLFGADPSTHSRCTLGGMIGNNACGTHSVAWGRTADNVTALEVVTYRGTVIRLGEMTQAEIDEAIAADDERAQLIASLHRLAQANLQRLRTDWAGSTRQVSTGYALEHLLPENRFNLAKAFVGSEGNPCGDPLRDRTPHHPTTGVRPGGARLRRRLRRRGRGTPNCCGTGCWHSKVSTMP